MQVEPGIKLLSLLVIVIRVFPSTGPRIGDIEVIIGQDVELLVHVDVHSALCEHTRESEPVHHPLK